MGRLHIPSSLRRIVFAFPLTAVVAGCAILFGGGEPPIVGNLLTGKSRSVIIERLSTESKLPANLKALVRATVTRPADAPTSDESSPQRTTSTESFRYAVVYATPDKIRFDLFPLNSAITLQQLTATGGRATLIDFTTKEAISGDTAETFSKSFLQVPASEQEVASLILGRVPPLSLTDASLRIYQSNSEIAVVKGNNEFSWRMRAESLAMEELKVHEKVTGKLLATARYSDMIMCGAHQIPGKVVVTLPTDGSTLTFTHTKSECATSVRSDLFDLRIPRGFAAREG